MWSWFVIVCVIPLASVSGGRRDVELRRLADRLDVLVARLETESDHRRRDVAELLDAFVYMETRFNATVYSKDWAAAASGKHGDELEPEWTAVVERLKRRVDSLSRGFRVEKKQNVRLRRYLPEVQSLMDGLEQKQTLVSDTLIAALATLDDVKTSVNQTNISVKSLAGDISKTREHITQRCDTQNETNGQLKSMQAEIEKLQATIEPITKPTAEPAVSCVDVLRRGDASSGVYTISPRRGRWSLPVYCDQVTDGGGWTVFQRRQDGTEDFSRSWLDYMVGFGDLRAEFWLGNENLHILTQDCCHELLIDMEDFENNKKYALYSNFSVGPASNSFILSVQGFSGDAGDSLAYHNGFSFSTKDDGKSFHCSQMYGGGGWWYDSCHHANLNGLYLSGENTPNSKGVNWLTWRGFTYSMKRVEMKLR